MGTSTELSERCRRLLEGELRPDELPIAWGRADYARSASDARGGQGHTYLVVTPDRVLWTDFSAPRQVHRVAFGDLASYAEGRYQHRLVLILRHTPVERVEWAPRWRFLWLRWGNAHAAQVRTETIFTFSRPDTKAATAIRRRLTTLAVPIAAPPLLPAPPSREALRAHLRADEPRKG